MIIFAMPWPIRPHPKPTDPYKTPWIQNISTNEINIGDKYILTLEPIFGHIEKSGLSKKLVLKSCFKGNIKQDTTMKTKDGAKNSIPPFPLQEHYPQYSLSRRQANSYRLLIKFNYIWYLIEVCGNPLLCWESTSWPFRFKNTALEKYFSMNEALPNHLKFCAKRMWSP